MDWRQAVVDLAWPHPALWRGLKALHPRYISARCRLRRRPRLRWVGLEVTNRCNLACVMCSNRLSRRERGLMSTEVFDDVMRQIPDGSLHQIVLHSVGEPLLHPNLELFIKQARRKARDTFLSTNGLLFDRDTGLMRRLLDAGLTHVHFSSDGYDAPTYEAVRVGGRFEDFLENLRLFRKVRDDSGSKAGIHMQYTLVRPHSPDEIRRVKAVFGPHLDDIEFRPLNNQSHTAVGYRPGESIEGLRCYADDPLPCLAMWCGLTVLWDGRVSVCPRDHSAAFVVGDLGSPLHAAWSGSAARTLRAAHARRRFPTSCAHCSELHARRLAIIELDRRLNAIDAGDGASGCTTARRPAGGLV